MDKSELRKPPLDKPKFKKGDFVYVFTILGLSREVVELDNVEVLSITEHVTHTSRTTEVFVDDELSDDESGKYGSDVRVENHIYYKVEGSNHLFSDFEIGITKLDRDRKLGYQIRNRL